MASSRFCSLVSLHEYLCMAVFKLLATIFWCGRASESKIVKVVEVAAGTFVVRKFCSQYILNVRQ